MTRDKAIALARKHPEVRFYRSRNGQWLSYDSGQEAGEAIRRMVAKDGKTYSAAELLSECGEDA